VYWRPSDVSSGESVSDAAPAAVPSLALRGPSLRPSTVPAWPFRRWSREGGARLSFSVCCWWRVSLVPPVVQGYTQWGLPVGGICRVPRLHPPAWSLLPVTDTEAATVL